MTPTSNHNKSYDNIIWFALYIFWLLHQTTTLPDRFPYRPKLYIFWLLHQTTTCTALPFVEYTLYIFWLLHQTTTCVYCFVSIVSCISFDSYIKPQPSIAVYFRTICCISFDSYIKPQLQGVRTKSVSSCISFDSYIKPQLTQLRNVIAGCCISFDSYIKPQLVSQPKRMRPVVYLLTPTSNHNTQGTHGVIDALYIFWLLHQTTTPPLPPAGRLGCISFDSYIKPQLLVLYIVSITVVYLLTPTSNHNHLSSNLFRYSLYIFWLLHQTTTFFLMVQHFHGCISFDSYIKPQLGSSSYKKLVVVYLLTPTSNHNIWCTMNL